MLCRSLYEDLVATQWALLPENRLTVIERVIRQERHWDELYEQAVDKVLGREPAPDELSEEVWKELHSEFEGGRSSWFGRLGKARREVVERLGEDERRELDFLGEVINRLANMTLHNTVDGLLQGAGKPLHYRGRFFFDYPQWRSPPEERMRDVFFAASRCYGWIVSVVLHEFGIDATAVSEACAEVTDALVNLMPSARRKLGPNDRCWCGSGLKLKKCHEV
jgi:hypothetical protein